MLKDGRWIGNALFDKKQGLLMDERHIGCQDRENVRANPIQHGLEKISQFLVVESFCGIWLNEPHFTPRCLVYFHNCSFIDVAINLTQLSDTRAMGESLNPRSVFNPILNSTFS